MVQSNKAISQFPRYTGALTGDELLLVDIPNGIGGYTTKSSTLDTLQSFIDIPTVTMVTMVQMRKALVSTGGGAIYAVSDNIPADIADPVNIAWSAGSTVTPGDVLAVSIQASLGYSASQMDALFALARTL